MILSDTYIPMTYTVSSGTLNSSIPYHTYIPSLWMFIHVYCGSYSAASHCQHLQLFPLFADKMCKFNSGTNRIFDS